MVNVCPNCKKEFWIGPLGWGYDYDGFYTCSYKCMKEMERKDAGRMRGGLTEAQKAKIDELKAAGMSGEKIAQHLGVSVHKVYHYYKTLRAVPEDTKEKAEVEKLPEIPELPARAPDDPTKLLILGLIRDMLELVKLIYNETEPDKADGRKVS